MPASRSASTMARGQVADGLLVAPIGPRGRWAALRSLRAGMAALRDGGGRPALHFVLALSEDGRVVPGRSPDASLFVLAYRSR
ncbi:MAG: hypothetical protein ACRDI0_01315 [Actinomycetota bacterium]